MLHCKQINTCLFLEMANENTINVYNTYTFTYIHVYVHTRACTYTCTNIHVHVHTIYVYLFKSLKLSDHSCFSRSTQFRQVFCTDFRIHL